MTQSLKVMAVDRSGNAMFNDNTMKLGIFCLNVSQGTFMTSAEGTLTPTWDESARVARVADDAGWEFLLPLGRWRGSGGATDFNGKSFDVFTWAAAIAAITKQIQVFCTAHVPIWHPLLAAKLSTTIDHVGNGRVGINVVMGWNEGEEVMFGVGAREHDDRYDMGEEWITIVKRIWTEDAPFDFDGKYYQLKSVFMEPKPIQKPHPVVVNAGRSPVGMRYGGRHADFTFHGGRQLEDIRALVVEARRIAAEEHREVGALTSGPVICRDTEKEVQDYLRYVVDERGDWEGARRLVASQLKGDTSVPPEEIRARERNVLAGWGGYKLFGTPEQIVDRMVGLSKAGINGIALSWVDYEAGIEQFNAKVLPLMEQAGLRVPRKG